MLYRPCLEQAPHSQRRDLCSLPGWRWNQQESTWKREAGHRFKQIWRKSRTRT